MQVCKFFQSGRCVFGDACKSLHPESISSNGLGDGTRGTYLNAKSQSNVPCKFWISGNCPFDQHCRYLHSDNHRIQDSVPHKRPASRSSQVSTRPPSPSVRYGEIDHEDKPSVAEGVGPLHDTAQPDRDDQPSPLPTHAFDQEPDGRQHTDLSLEIEGDFLGSPGKQNGNLQETEARPSALSDAGTSKSSSVYPSPPESETYFRSDNDSHIQDSELPSDNKKNEATQSDFDVSHEDQDQDQDVRALIYPEPHSSSARSLTSARSTISHGGSTGDRDKGWEYRDGNVPQSYPLPQTVPQVTLHWSEYADPLADSATPFCKFFAQGRCVQGDNCNFRHSLTINEYALLFRDAQPILWSSRNQVMGAEIPKAQSASAFGVCKFYPLGKCRNGDACTYLHVPPSDSPLASQQTMWDQPEQSPGLRNIPVCNYYMSNGYCKKGDDCHYRHDVSVSSEYKSGEQGQRLDRWESRSGDDSSRSASRKPRPCKYFFEGSCRNGDSCDFLHEGPDAEEGGSGNQDESWANGGWGVQDPAQYADRWNTSPPPETSLEASTSQSWNVPSDGIESAENRPLVDDDATWKTSRGDPEPRICASYQKGYCRKGSRCKFSHQEPKREPHDLSWNEVSEPTPWDLSVEERPQVEESLEQVEDARTEGDADKIVGDSKNNGASWGSEEVRPPPSNEDDEETWSTPWKDEAEVSSTLPRQINKPCKAFGQGFCKWGDDCIYLHITPEDPASDDDEPPSIEPRNETSEDEGTSKQGSHDSTTLSERGWMMSEPQTWAEPEIKRDIFNCAVRFDGTEYSPQHIVTASDSHRVFLSNLPLSFDDDIGFQNNTLSVYGSLKDILLEENRTSLSAVVECEDYTKATEAVVQLHGQTYDSRTILVRQDTVALERVMSPLITHSLQVSWPAPSTFAWVFYPTITIAKEQEKRLNGMSYQGRTIKAEFHRPTRKQLDSFAIKITNLPIDAIPMEVKAFCQCKLESVGKPSYIVSPLGEIRKFLAEHGRLDSFDVLPSDPTKSKVTAFARFDLDLEELSFLIGMNGAEQPFLDKKCLWIRPVFHAVYRLSKQRLNAVLSDLKELEDTHKEHCTISISDQEEPITIHISAAGSAENATGFGHANLHLQALLHGEVMMRDGEKLWDEYFYLSSSSKILEKLNANGGFLIKVDYLNQAVRIVGSKEGRKQAQAKLSQILSSVRESRRIIPVNRFYLGPLLNRNLLDSFGANKVTLDVRTSTLTVRGDTTVHDKVLQVLDAVSIEPVVLGDSRSICAVCYCIPSVPIKLSCRHVYCKACLQHVLKPSESPPFIPPRCIAIGEVPEDEPPETDPQCQTPIPYSVIHEILPVVEEAILLRTSFLTHVLANPDEFFFCPTPNCETVYRRGRQGGVYQCPACFTQVCSTCRAEYHGGLTCEERLRQTL